MDRAKLVSVSVAVTLAPGTAAPEGSVTVPVMAPSAWAYALVEIAPTQIARQMTMQAKRPAHCWARRHQDALSLNKSDMASSPSPLMATLYQISVCIVIK